MDSGVAPKPDVWVNIPKVFLYNSNSLLDPGNAMLSGECVINTVENEAVLIWKMCCAVYYFLLLY